MAQVEMPRERRGHEERYLTIPPLSSMPEAPAVYHRGTEETPAIY